MRQIKGNNIDKISFLYIIAIDVLLNIIYNRHSSEEFDQERGYPI